MGIWSQWVCPGVALAALSTPLLYGAFGWRSIFCLSLALAGGDHPARSRLREDAGRSGKRGAHGCGAGRCGQAFPRLRRERLRRGLLLFGMVHQLSDVQHLLSDICPDGAGHGHVHGVHDHARGRHCDYPWRHPVRTSGRQDQAAQTHARHRLRPAHCRMRDGLVGWVPKPGARLGKHILPGILLCGPRSHHVARAHPGACPGSSGHRLCSDRHGVRGPGPPADSSLRSSARSPRARPISSRHSLSSCRCAPLP